MFRVILLIFCNFFCLSSLSFIVQSFRHHIIQNIHCDLIRETLRLLANRFSAFSHGRQTRPLHLNIDILKQINFTLIQNNVYFSRLSLSLLNRSLFQFVQVFAHFHSRFDKFSDCCIFRARFETDFEN